LSGGGWERIGVLPDIVTSSEEALSTALEHARETIRGTPTAPWSPDPLARPPLQFSGSSRAGSTQPPRGEL